MMEEEKYIAQKCSKHTKSTTYNMAVCPFKVEYMDTETNKKKNIKIQTIPFIDTFKTPLELFFLIIPETDFPGLLRSPGCQRVNTSTRGHSELLIIFQAMAETLFLMILFPQDHQTRKGVTIWGGIIGPDHQEETGQRCEGKEKYV